MDECISVLIPMVPGSKLSKDVDGVRIDKTYYRQMVGSLMYLSATRPDMMYSISLINRFVETPTELHQQAVRKIFRYFKGTIDYGLFYKKGKSQELVGFCDSDYPGDLNDRRNTSGYVFSQEINLWLL